MYASAIPRVYLIRSSLPTEPIHAVYEPAFCIVAQGRKQVILADQVYVYSPDQCLVVSVDLPVVGQVLEATREAPYLCMRLDLDPAQISALMVETDGMTAVQEQDGLGLCLTPADPELLSAATRLLRLLETPEHAPVLAPLIEREIYYRLLTGPHGGRLRQIAMAESRLQSVNRAISWIKQNFTKPVRIETIARQAGMSPSALHYHFKAVTAMSPLQYQKLLRLQEARRLMLGHAMDAATASHSVGYESPSQFSREYGRLFGAPPSRDIARLRGLEVEQAQGATSTA